MTSIPQVVQALQTVLTVIADQAGRASDFIVRQVKLRGSTFVQLLVFGFLADPHATLEALAQTAAVLGVHITPQALDLRFTETAAACLEQVLAAAVAQVIAVTPIAVPILERFPAVEVQDSTTITLPPALADVFFGCGEGTASMKVHLGLNLRSGSLRGPTISDGCTHDSTVRLPGGLPADSLHLTDLGYFGLARFQSLSEQQQFWLSRYKTGTLVWDAAGVCWDLPDLLASQAATVVDLEVRLGQAATLECRLLAVRAPQEVVDQRRRRLYADARRRGSTPSAASLALAAWTILITNVPVERLSVREALIVARTRWQIELLFKLWKSHGRLDESRSDKPWRMLCEVYAKLVAMLVQHWILVVCCWCYPDRSLTKAAQTIRRLALHLAGVLHDPDQLTAALAIIADCLSIGCRINKRKKEPHTYQLLFGAVADGLA
jgi:Transposase DDE domain